MMHGAHVTSKTATQSLVLRPVIKNLLTAFSMSDEGMYG